MTSSAVLIFGGTSPLCLAIADGLITKNKNPIIATRSISKFQQKVPASERYKTLEINLEMNQFSVENLVKTFKTVEIEAIIFSHRYLGNPEVLHDRMQVEIYTPLLIIDEFIKLKKNYPRSVIFLTSPLAKTIQIQQSVGYHMSKSAMTSLTKYYAVKYGGENLRFNCISPGPYFEKERSKVFYSQNPDIKNSITSKIPVKKFGKGSDISNAVNFLLDESSSYLNGIVLEVDGGLTNVDQSTLI
jgi:NAD(P)-dependent dehydrogenase (short-subunit alcohol dehydrogenase family)